MADEFLKIRIEGLDKVISGLEKMNGDLSDTLRLAGNEAGDEILNTKGLRSYPPVTDANRPPTPYYVRGRGMQRGGRRIPEYNDNKSEKSYGTKFYIKPQGKFSTAIGNPVSYAPFLGGEEQAEAMAKIGWRKLWDVAKEKIDKIEKIYQDWIDRLIRKHGL
jgi:hypothetical protein